MWREAGVGAYGWFAGERVRDKEGTSVIFWKTRKDKDMQPDEVSY